jgi:hypothetical protein
MKMMPRTRADAQAIALFAILLAAMTLAKITEDRAVPLVEERVVPPVEERAVPPVEELAALPLEDRETSVAIADAAPPVTPPVTREQEHQSIFARYKQTLIRPAHDRVVMQYMPRILRAVLDRAAEHFAAPVLVTSAYRSPPYNRRVGGVRRSMHMVRDGKRGAVDFKVVGVSKGVLYAWAKRQPEVNGIGLYCRSDFIHVDNGQKRSWYWGCGRRHDAKGSKRVRMADAVARSYGSDH